MALQAIAALTDLRVASDPAAHPDATRYLPDPERHATYRAALLRGARLERLLYPDTGAWDDPPADRPGAPRPASG